MSAAYDCCVVGSGPSGSSLAYFLARRGKKVLLLEKLALPRYKPCGGGLAPTVQDFFDFDLAPSISTKVRKIRYTFAGERPIDAEIDTAEPLWMVRREVFDNFLCEQAAKAGTEVLDQTALKGLRESEAGWTVITDKGEFECGFVAACDGAKGQTASFLGFKDRQRSIAGAIEAEHPEPMSEPVLHLEMGMVRRGYLWNFPKADGQSLGIGVFRQKKESSDPIRDRLDDYVKLFGLELSDCEQHGHPINLWNGHQRLHSRNAVLVGDAACLVDPFTAEGIRPSIHSARIAADSLLDAMEHGEKLDGYSRRVQQEIGEEMKWAARIATMFYQFPQAGYRAFAESATGTQRLGQLLTGERTYKDLAGSAIERLKAKIGL